MAIKGTTPDNKTWIAADKIALMNLLIAQGYKDIVLVTKPSIGNVVIVETTS